MSIITRILKGFPLTWTEVDQNFTDLDNLKAPKASPSFTGIVSGITKAMVGLGNVDDKSSATIRGEINLENVTSALGFTPENAANKGAANGFAGLDGAGKVPATQLPSYVDDVVEVASYSALPTTGETGKIYVAIDTNKIYRWSGSTYVEIAASAPAIAVDPVAMSIIFGV